LFPQEENANVIVNALHPGVIQTGLARHMPKIAVVLMSESQTRLFYRSL
jgi:hypothetical protein